MSLTNKINDKEKDDLRLTVEDIDSQECFKNLSPEAKERLISFIFELSHILYHSNNNCDD